MSSNSEKQAGVVLRAEGAGYFLLKLDHPNIAFSRIVVKRHTEVAFKSQGFGFIVPESNTAYLG